MPYKSLKQERYFNANRKKLEKKGVNVAEWNKASKGKKLPEKKHTPINGDTPRPSPDGSKMAFNLSRPSQEKRQGGMSLSMRNKK